MGLQASLSCCRVWAMENESKEEKFDPKRTAIAAAIFAPVVAIEGVVISDLWGWFIAPLGVPGIGWAHAAGIAVLIGLLVHQAKPKNKNDEDKPAWEKIADAGLLALFLWGMGWLVHWTMVATS